MSESWEKAAQALIQHWKKNGPEVSPQWCSDAARLLEFALELSKEEPRELD